MNIGYLIWFVLFPVFIFFLYIFVLRDYFLTKRFKQVFGETETFVQWFQEKGPFQYSTFMKEEAGNIVIGKGNVALYKFIITGELKFGRYCVVLKDTGYPDGLYGSSGGHIVRVCSPLTLFPKVTILKNVSSLFSRKQAPECVEIIEGKAYLYFPLNNWFGFQSIFHANQCAN